MLQFLPGYSIWKKNQQDRGRGGSPGCREQTPNLEQLRRPFIQEAKWN